MPAISPLAANQASYTITDSKVVLANFSLDFNVSDTRQFQLTYPAAVPVPTITLTLIQGGGASRTTMSLQPSMGSIPNYGVSVNVVDGATPGTKELTCFIQDLALLGTIDEQFELLAVTTDETTDWTLAVLGGSNFEVRRMICDPDTNIAPVPAPVLEKSTITLAATDPTVGTEFGSVPWAGAPAPTITYGFGHTGTIAINDLDITVNADPDREVDLPGVYGPTVVPFTVTVTRTSTDPQDTWSFTHTGTRPVTIDARPQRVVLVLDRSGSMFGQPWENAKTSARMFVDLFGQFRNNVNVEDAIGIVAFEDEGGFRDPDEGGLPSGLIEEILPLTKPQDAALALSTLDFGDPGQLTNIGDGLVKGLTMLSAPGIPPGALFTAVLMTDGFENSGTVKIEPVGTDGIGLPKSFAVRKLEADIAALELPATVERELRLFTIGLGASVNNAVLSALAVDASGQYTAALDVSDLVAAFGDMLAASQEVVLRQSRNTPNAADPPSAVTTEVYFTTNDADKLGFVVLGATSVAGPLFTIKLAQRPQGVGAFSDVTITPKVFGEHVYVGIDNVPSIGTGARDWLVTNMNGAVPQNIAPSDVLAYEDLHLKADLLVDRPNNLTGDKLNFTVRIRHDAAPILGATVRAELDAPGEGLGALLSGLTNGSTVAAKADGDKRLPDHLYGKGGLIQALLDHHDWKGLPRCNPGDTDGLFVDGTDLLHDPDGDGNYTNTFAKVFKEGVYNWTVRVSGLDADGGTFDQVLRLTTVAQLSISGRKTTVTRTKVPGYQLPKMAVKVTITPQDARREKLGPGFDDTVIWSVQDGKFEHVLKQEPAPVNTDGTYTRTIVFNVGRFPKLRVSVNGTLLPTIDVFHLLPQ